jgi:hypothetical protein
MNRLANSFDSFDRITRITRIDGMKEELIGASPNPVDLRHPRDPVKEPQPVGNRSN